MIVALVVTLLAVVGGAAIAAVTSRDNVALGALRTFALAAVVGVVLVQILPESVEPLGGAALLAFLAALVLPALVRHLLAWLRRDVAIETLGADLGYLGFLLHQLAEGLALGTLTGSAHADHAHGDLVLGMAAHTVPLTAVFVAAWLASRGRASAVRRTVGLLVASALGFALAGSVQSGSIAAIQPWLGAFVAGFLCHVLLHVEPPRGARSVGASALDVLGVAAGVLLPLLAADLSHGAEHGGELVRTRLGAAFVELALVTAPLLLLGLLLAAGVQVLGTRIPRRYEGGGPSRQALRGIAVGAPLPLCACGILPSAASMRRQGAGPAMVMAFLLAIPGLGLETLLITVVFLGGPFAGVRLSAGVVVAWLGAVAFARAAHPSPPASEETVHDVLADAGESMILGVSSRSPASLQRLWGYFDELLLHTGPWVFVGLVAAAYVDAVVPAGALGELAASGADVFLVGLVALPTYVCAVAATPVAAVLLAKGMSTGAVLTGLLLGPAINLAGLAALGRAYGRRAVATGLAMVVAAALGAGWIANATGLEAELGAAAPSFGGGALVILGLALGSQLWRWGTRPWFVILDLGGHAHVDGPGHAHGHPHDHDHHHHHDHDDDHEHSRGHDAEDVGLRG